MLRISLTIPLLIAAMACVPPPPPALAGAPEALKVPASENPDVIWLVRPVQLERESQGFGGASNRTHYGLFACYRSPTAEPPKCHLAEVAGKKKHLVWPDDPKTYDLADERNLE